MFWWCRFGVYTHGPLLLLYVPINLRAANSGFRQLLMLAMKHCLAAATSIELATSTGFPVDDTAIVMDCALIVHYTLNREAEIIVLYVDKG